MGVMMLGWSQSNMNEQKIEMNEVFNTQMNKIREDLLFQNIWFATPAGSMTENHLNITVSNIGILGLNITSIQVTNTTGTNNTSIEPYTFANTGIIPESSGGILASESTSLNATYPWDSGDELDVVIFTNRGNQFLSQVIAP